MKKTQIVALLAIAVAVVLIFVMAGDSSTYKTFNQAVGKGKKEFHIIGVLVPEMDISYDPKVDPDLFSFYMKDDSGTVKKVVYHEPKPTDFERSDKIVVTGRMKDDEFVASKILLKCPSKYVDDEIELKEANAQGV